MTSGQRLGIYVDDVYHIDRRGSISTDRAFLLFACEVGRTFQELTVFGRTLRDDRPADYTLPAGTALVALPYYDDLKQPRAVARAAAGTLRSMWRGLSAVDIVWIFGPHPFGFVLVAMAGLRRKRVVLGVRQDTVGYVMGRMPSAHRWSAPMVVVRLLDGLNRLLARRIPATVVGPAIRDHYGGERPNLLEMTVSLVPATALDGSGTARVPGDPVELLTVGRLEVEKNPLLVIDMLAELERRNPGRYRLTWVGRGELERDVREHAARQGVDGLIELRGYVPFGEQLLSLYRRADLFVHVSLTEGLPQVLVEALACATPVVATAVGSVPDVLEAGAAGILVPPDDRDALVDAVERLTRDAQLRARLVERGTEVAASATLDHQAGRVAAFIRSGRRDQA